MDTKEIKKGNGKTGKVEGGKLGKELERKWDKVPYRHFFFPLSALGLTK